MRKLFYLKALMLSLCMAVSFVLPVNAQRNDNFWVNEEDDTFRSNITSAIIINNFNDTTPLGSGLLIMVAAGAGYAVARRRRIKGVKAVNGFKGFNAIIIAFVLLVGMTQCKKNDIAKTMTSNGVQITLNVDNNSKYEVNPPYVTFESGDKIIVGYNGYYVGYLTYVQLAANSYFTGAIYPGHLPSSPEKLHFYFLGNYYNDMLDPDYDQHTNIPDLLSDQTTAPKVLSYGVSKENYGSTNYTAELDNQCTLVKFTLPGEGTSNTVKLKSMNTSVYVDFDNGLITMNMGTSDITLYKKGSINTERYAILFPYPYSQNTKIVYDDKEYDVTIPPLDKNAYININVSDTPTPTPPTPSSDPVFSVAANKQVEFSKGNLQYNGGNGSWRFAETQYSYESSWTYSSWVDLMGYGTWWPVSYSGALPTQTDTNDGSYGWDGDFTGYTLDGHDDWFTLSSNEWVYLCNTRATGVTVNSTEDARYTMAIIYKNSAAIKGLILFPDNYTTGTPSGVTWGTINAASNWITMTTVCTSAGWDALDDAGCVFLPAAGRRWDTDIYDQNSACYYWSQTNNKCLLVGRDISLDDPEFVVNPNKTWSRSTGMSVRLVRDVTPSSK